MGEAASRRAGVGTMSRFHQVLLIATLLPLCWLGMMAVHELGHVAAARATGGQVQRVMLGPLAFSRTDVGPNPRPLVVAWGGAAVGTLLPLAAWALAALLRLPGAYLLRFFAGFCLVANGAYLGGGAIGRVADAGELLRHGAAAWHLWAFAAITVPLGLLLWHRQGRWFGLGPRARRVHPAAAWTSAILLALVVAAELLLA